MRRTVASMPVTGLLAAGCTGCAGQRESGTGIVDCVRLLRLDGRTYVERAVLDLPLRRRLGAADELVCDGSVPQGETPAPPTPNGERVDAYRAGRGPGRQVRSVAIDPLAKTS